MLTSIKEAVASITIFWAESQSGFLGNLGFWKERPSVFTMSRWGGSLLFANGKEPRTGSFEGMYINKEEEIWTFRGQVEK